MSTVQYANLLYLIMSLLNFNHGLTAGFKVESGLDYAMCHNFAEVWSNPSLVCTKGKTDLCIFLWSCFTEW